MNITYTDIPDININPDIAKADLGNKVVEGISPLLNEYYLGKSTEVNELKIQLKNVRKEVLNKKNQLQKQMQLLERKKKVKQLLGKVSTLINAGLGYDNSFRNEVIILLKVIDNLSDTKLDFHLKDITTLIKKRFK